MQGGHRYLQKSCHAKLIYYVTVPWCTYDWRGKTRTRVFQETGRIFLIIRPRNFSLLGNPAGLTRETRPIRPGKPSNPAAGERARSSGTTPPLQFAGTHIQTGCVHGAIHGHFKGHYFCSSCPGTPVAPLPLRTGTITGDAATQSIVVRRRCRTTQVMARIRDLEACIEGRIRCAGCKGGIQRDPLPVTTLPVWYLC